MKALPLILLVSTAEATCPAPSVTVTTGKSVTLSWTAPTTYTDGSVITGAVTYNLYDNLSTPPALRLSGITGTSVVRSGISGMPCWVVTAVVGGVESAPSGAVAAATLAAPLVPTAPANLTVK